MTYSQLRNDWAEDLKVFKLANGPLSLPSLIYKTAWCHFYHPQATCVFWYRLNQILPGRAIISARRIFWFGNEISYKAKIGAGLRLPHMHDIVVGGEARIGSHATIFNGVSIGRRRVGVPGMPKIGNYVTIGPGAKILGDITIGNNVTIGALAFVNKDIPDNSTVYGIPPHVTIKSSI